MNDLIALMTGIQRFFLNKIKLLDFTPLLLLRIYLAPIFIIAGWGKLTAIDSTTYYFGEMLGMPFPESMAYLAGGAEFFGGIAILIGLATRWFAIPLIMTMAVAAGTAHWDQGWHALPDDTLTMPWEWRKDLIEEGIERRTAARALLKEHGNYEWLTSAGNITILKNGIEFSVTYILMLLPLLFFGAGRLSIDYFLYRLYMRKDDTVPVCSI